MFFSKQMTHAYNFNFWYMCSFIHRDAFPGYVFQHWYSCRHSCFAKIFYISVHSLLRNWFPFNTLLDITGTCLCLVQNWIEMWKRAFGSEVNFGPFYDCIISFFIKTGVTGNCNKMGRNIFLYPLLLPLHPINFILTELQSYTSTKH